MTDLTLTVERVIAAPPEDVFKAWLDPETLRKFMTPEASMSVPRASTDPREGGRFAIIMEAGGQELPHSVTYTPIDPHKRIAFTWESAWSPDDSLVELDFTPQGDGTKVTLTHTRFLDEERRDNHERGWTEILACFEDLAFADA